MSRISPFAGRYSDFSRACLIGGAPKTTGTEDELFDERSGSGWRRRSTSDELPTVFHLTHHKAGSQWIHAILRDVVPDRIVTPQPDMAHYLQQPVRRGGVYPTLYLNRQTFESVEVVGPSRRFVVIRDLRDTIVSAYHSIRWSHVPMAGVSEFRHILEGKTDEEGLSWVVEVLANFWADIQMSWIGSPDPIVRYEDLLTDDVGLLGDVLLGHCRLPVAPDRLGEAIRASRFEQLAGRRLGEEDRGSHLRRGLPGDWRHHFTPRVTEAFKQRFADVLVTTGYEPDASW